MMIDILVAFLIKHFICDFPLQTAYQYKNKGIYGHPGGILHAAIHGFGTLVICLGFGLPLWFAAFDALIHYHIDWAKNRLVARYRLTHENNGFWYLIGLDQLLHQLTYAWIIQMAASG